MAHERQYFIRNQNPFDLSDKLFIKHFRLTKDLVRYLIDTLDNFLIAPTRTSSIDKATKVLVALNFFATGSYQTSVGSNLHCSSVSQPTVSRCVNEVVQALNNPEICNQWIIFPNTLAELQQNRWLFYERYNSRGNQDYFVNAFQNGSTKFGILDQHLLSFNKLPSNIKNQQSLSTFKRALKNYLFEKQNNVYQL